MKTISLKINETVYDKVMYFLQSLPKKDVQIIDNQTIEEFDPTSLPESDFDYMSKDYLKKIDDEIEKAKKEGLDKLQTYEEFRNEL